MNERRHGIAKQVRILSVIESPYHLIEVSRGLLAQTLYRAPKILLELTDPRSD